MLEGAALTTAMTLGLPYGVRLYRLYKEMKHAQRLESDIYRCLSYANLILRLSLEKDLASFDEAREDKRSRIEEAKSHKLRGGSYHVNLATGERWPLSPLELEALPLNYRWRSGEISPYHAVIQELHTSISARKHTLVELTHRNGADVDLSFLDWEIYGQVFQDMLRRDIPQYNMTTYAFSVMQDKYFDLFAFAHEHLRNANKRIRDYIFVLLEFPKLGDCISTRLAVVDREHVVREARAIRRHYEANEENITGMTKISTIGY